MTEKNFNTNNNIGQEKKELSLEELDLLCRKCHHMHDEEVFHILSRVFHKVTGLFKHNEHHHGHPVVR